MTVPGLVASACAQRHRLQPYATSALLLPACAYFALVDVHATGAIGVPWLLAHALNLIVHEAGHVFFGFFGTGFWGTLAMFAGGSLLQLLLPAVFVWSTVAAPHKVGAQLSLLWLGQSFVDVSVYAADAQARALPLLGGLGAEAHDWHNMLHMTGLLEHTPLVAAALYACAFPLWAAMLAVPRWIW